MKIGIVGGGAIGLLVAAYLGKEYKVTVYTRRSPQAKRLQNEGLRLEKKGETMCISIQAAPFAEAAIDDDIVFITVKQYDMSSVLDNTERFRHVQTIVFLQNGMGHVEKLAAFAEKNVVVGVVEHGAIKRDDRTVEHTGIGKIVLASLYGTLQDVMPLAARCISDFSFEIADDWEQVLVKKLIVNAVINPLTALLRVPNGKLLQVAPYYEMMKLLFSELQQVLPIKDGAAAWKHIVNICQKTAENYSSMYMDIARHRKTEVDAILGYVLKKGDELGIELPLSQFLFYAIKGMEEGGEKHG
ncbi:2-dehydropantoate 2-reductase [Parageobacillus sp. VR-IP]|uniref:2-dehydropantoate 2-reductase n=1 Tax=Parageobacillus sp. VR-IP TaxID=2742205 RepID=UPI001581DA8E|nr:2-dehydropantoate 2-reductase [Parageobacillus sp. VR-IP]NUK29015.1 2-dehydropantoate 2-reductase [Parageobacillus sp. VR-IP]